MKKIRLYDGRDKSFELTGTLEDICNYMGYDMTAEGINDFYDLDEKIESENAGMNFYHVEEVKEYAIRNGNIDSIDGSEVIFTSQNKKEIVEYLKATDRDFDDENTIIETYYVDEDDEFYEGSDYDIPTNYIKNIDLR